MQKRKCWNEKANEHSQFIGKGEGGFLAMRPLTEQVATGVRFVRGAGNVDITGVRHWLPFTTISECRSKTSLGIQRIMQGLARTAHEKCLIETIVDERL